MPYCSIKRYSHVRSSRPLPLSETTASDHPQRLWCSLQQIKDFLSSINQTPAPNVTARNKDCFHSVMERMDKTLTHERSLMTTCTLQSPQLNLMASRTKHVAHLQHTINVLTLQYVIPARLVERPFTLHRCFQEDCVNRRPGSRNLEASRTFMEVYSEGNLSAASNLQHPLGDG